MDHELAKANAAWSEYRAACATNHPNGARVIQRAIEEIDSIAVCADARSAAWFETRILLGHILIGSASLLVADQTSERVALRLHRAETLAHEVMEACEPGHVHLEQRRAATGLYGLAALARFQLLGDWDGLQDAMRHADAFSASVGSAGLNLELAAVQMDLYLTHFEVTGNPEDLERGIRLGDECLTDAHVPEEPTPALASIPAGRVGTTRHHVMLSLCKLLAFRAQEAVSAENPNEMSLARDCARSVHLARAADVGFANGSPLERALAANALGLALNAQAILTRDVRLMGEATLSLLRAVQWAGWETPAGQLFASNAASAMGQLAQALPALRVGDGPGTVLDDAIAILEQLLERSGAASERRGMQTLQVKFNYARLVVQRAALGGPLADPSRLMSAITDCTDSLISGHRQRAHALAILAAAHLATSSAGTGTDGLRGALTAALEAEAISESHAPSAEYPPEHISRTLARWRKEGGSEADILDGRVTAARQLMEALPEYAASLADHRALEALERGDVARAADYAEIAVSAGSRALIVGDDLELAYRLASSVGIATAVHRSAVAIAHQAPDRAVMLLERSQANVMGRLQLSLEGLEATHASGHSPIGCCLNARRALRALIRARREGRISATAEALRKAEEELEAATRAVRQLPGMSRLLVEIADFAQLRYSGAPCVFIVAGMERGVAFLVGRAGPPTGVLLPLLDENTVRMRVGRYLAAVAQFESDGPLGLGRFQDALRESTEWLEEAVLRLVRCHFIGERWTCIPCGMLCNLPWSAATASDPIAYTPNIQISARTRSVTGARSLLLVCEPEHDGTSELPGAAELAGWMEHIVGTTVTVLRGSEATPQIVLQALHKHETVLFYAHGSIDPVDPLRSGVLLHGDSRLDIRTIMANSQALTGRIVVLASCSQGHPDPQIPSEMWGPATAFLAAGARMVLAPGWPVEALSARIIATTFVEALSAGLTPEEALVAAQQRVRGAGMLGAGAAAVLGLRRGRTVSSSETPSADLSFAHPYFSGAFAVYGGHSVQVDS